MIISKTFVSCWHNLCCCLSVTLATITTTPWVWLLLVSSSSFGVHARVYDFATDLGAIPFVESAAATNTDILQTAFQQSNVSLSGHTLRFAVNQTFYLQHGIVATNVSHVRLQLDGTLRFVRSDIPADDTPHSPFPACLTIADSHNITLTSTTSRGGIMDGQGSQWWGIPLIGYLQTVENRPRLLRFNRTKHLLIEHVTLQNSPYHSLYLDTVDQVEIRHVSIVARRTTQDGHSWVDLTAFNTDGIDVSGTNVWVHDVDIWVQDDCIAVKDVMHNHNLDGTTPPVSANMTFERINATGLGFVVGSIRGTHVHNITFRNSYLYKPVKGIYIKMAPRSARFRRMNRTTLIEHVKYQNITIVAPLQWPLWLGPAQQADNRNPCHANPCSLCWPMTPGSKCSVVPHAVLRNVTLQNVAIYNPSMATGVLLANQANPMENVLFDSVRVTMGLPPAITWRPLTETFPGTRLPVHDPFVPPAYAYRFQRRLAGVYGWIVNVVTTIGRFVTKVVERIHLALVFRLLQTQNGAQTWYWTYIGQALLNTVWVWIVCAVGFAIAGCFSWRGWRRYSQRLKERRQQRQRVSSADEQVVQSQEEENHTGRENDNAGDENNSGNGPIEEGASASHEQIEQGSLTESLLPRHPRVETRWPPLLCHLGYVLLLCICWGGALYTGTFPFRKPTWERTYRYYACESVVNGVARGNTWPIPSCFKNERPPWWHGGGNDDDDDDDDNKPPPSHHHRHHRHGSDHWSPHKVHVNVERFVLTAIAALTVLAIALWKHWKEQRQQRLGDGEEAVDGDASLPIPSFVTIDASQGDEEESVWPLQEHRLDVGPSDETRYVDPLASLCPGPN